MKPLLWLAGAGLVLLGAGYYIGTQTNVPNILASKVQPGTGAKILYYRNPMGLADTSPTPKKDSMGMDYLPVYETDTVQSDIVKVDNNKIQLLGVQTQTVGRQRLGRELRLLGTLAIDESKLADISPRFEGTVTKLLVNSTGQPVSKGDVLFEAAIPNLVNAEFAYKQAVKRAFEAATAAPDVQRQAELQLAAAMERLEEMGVPLDEMERLQRGGEPAAQIAYRAPVTGVVLEKNLVQGARFAAGDRLYQVADLSSLWLLTQLPESELPQVKAGDALRVGLLADPGKQRDAKVDFIYPTLDASNRSATLRAVIANPNDNLKPGQSAEVWLTSNVRDALAIEPSALLDSGQQQWVLVALADGVYQPRRVQVGERNGSWIEITLGLGEGEQVVSNANFLIDSESRLQVALAAFSQGELPAKRVSASSVTATATSEPASEHQHHHHTDPAADQASSAEHDHSHMEH